jgi:hypothetical protein
VWDELEIMHEGNTSIHRSDKEMVKSEMDLSISEENDTPQTLFTRSNEFVVGKIDTTLSIRKINCDLFFMLNLC